MPQVGQHGGLLPQLQLQHVRAHVVLHGVRSAVGLRRVERQGRGTGGEGRLRLPHGVHYHRVQHRAEVRPLPGGFAARLEGLRHCHAPRLTLPLHHLRRHSQAAGGRRAARAQGEVVAGAGAVRQSEGDAEGERQRLRARPRQCGRRLCGAGHWQRHRHHHLHWRVHLEDEEHSAH